jgi:LuxR family transcriptional regulator, quorum-sensing system regulator SolR
VVLRLEDYVDRSHQAKTIPELAEFYSRAIAVAGYENCVLSSVRGRRVGHVPWFEIPDGSTGAYVERRWESIGAVLARSVRVCRPFLWSEVAEASDASPKPRHCAGKDGGVVLHGGIAFPFHGPAYRLDLISISRCQAAAPDVGNSDLLYAISFHAWTRYLDLSNDPLVLGPVAEPLTPREVEILRWCKDGKTRPEIGEILSISHKTVEFHLSNVMTKLGASNQTAAVVIALQRGLIEL